MTDKLQFQWSFKTAGPVSFSFGYSTVADFSQKLAPSKLAYYRYSLRGSTHEVIFLQSGKSWFYDHIPELCLHNYSYSMFLIRAVLRFVIQVESIVRLATLSWVNLTGNKTIEIHSFCTSVLLVGQRLRKIRKVEKYLRTTGFWHEFS